MNKSLKAIATLKALRGCIALVIGIFLVQTSQNSKGLVWIKHPTLRALSESDPFLQQLVKFFTEFSQTQILHLGLLTICLGILRWVEAGGIWANKSWAQWIAVLTGFVYIPFEINALTLKFSWVMVLILIINLFVVIYLLSILSKKIWCQKEMVL